MESDPLKLSAFLNPVTVSGGIGREAIEVGLQFANEVADQHQNDSNPLSQVFIIGDIGPNTK